MKLDLDAIRESFIENGDIDARVVALIARIRSLESQVAPAQPEAEKLVEGLKSFEWGGTDREMDESACPSCGNLERSSQHRGDCKLAALITSATPAPALLDYLRFALRRCEVSNAGGRSLQMKDYYVLLEMLDGTLSQAPAQTNEPGILIRGEKTGWLISFDAHLSCLKCGNLHTETLEDGRRNLTGFYVSSLPIPSPAPSQGLTRPIKLLAKVSPRPGSPIARRNHIMNVSTAEDINLLQLVGDEIELNEIAYRINHFEAPTPIERKQP